MRGLTRCAAKSAPVLLLAPLLVLAGSAFYAQAAVPEAVPASAAVPASDDGSCEGDLPKLPAEPSKSLPKYEYCWDFSKPGADISRLNDLGKQGWEVVAPVGPGGIKDLNFLLRRQIP